MVERGERPEFRTGTPEKEEAPDFSGGYRSSNSEQDPAVLPLATPASAEEASVPVPESRPLTDGGSVVPDHDQMVGFEEIPKGGDTLADQNRVNAVFGIGADNNE